MKGKKRKKKGINYQKNHQQKITYCHELYCGTDPPELVTSKMSKWAGYRRKVLPLRSFKRKLVMI